MNGEQPKQGSPQNRLRASERQHYIWHVEQRGNDWFAVHQFGGWLRFRSPEQAQERIDKSVEQFGDTDRDKKSGTE